jgi:hypothetical protein
MRYYAAGDHLMEEPLAIYLHDHLAGAVVAIELLEVMRKRETPLGGFANHLLNEAFKQ